MIQYKVLFRFKTTLREDDVYRIIAALLTKDRYISDDYFALPPRGCMFGAFFKCVISPGGG